MRQPFQKHVTLQPHRIQTGQSDEEIHCYSLHLPQAVTTTHLQEEILSPSKKHTPKNTMGHQVIDNTQILNQ